MYEAVHAHPDGDSTVARQALTAAEYGFEGIVVRNHGDDPADYDAAAVADAYGIDVADGVEVRADTTSQASGLVGNHRSKRTVVVVHGGDRAINRFAVENPTVDVLAHPMRDDGDFNHVLANAAAENGVRVEFSLGPVLRDSGGSRVRALQDLRKLRELIEDADAPYVVSADPRSHLELRGPRELIALGERIGFTADQIRGGLEAWGYLVERNRRLTDDSFVEPGVRLDETDG
ncbi:RNase P subunit p30 family protein [Haloarcula pellucida]|uniref:Ribonuclease P protein component 3 n=1 Tax=Haloarcula pellucida TaxID=1427151 RepID=A0A830GGV3_9EURY|nr:RNase P subunit p30 family protein [Halomicroarcula pellucida]MBX0347145.1 ribonuclease P [Halomicroarcula pellucida]GGN87216.1 ribonuclease P [Halomicroarcula pellucida]